MSKMFDSLRWAEGERKKRLGGRLQEMMPAAGRQRKLVKSELVQSDLPDGLLRELGILRNSLDSLFSSKSNRSLLFTAATSGEGATTLATSFAKFLSLQQHERVLVCELNARRPSFTDVFSINGNAGVTEYFLTDKELASLVQSPSSVDLDVIHIGRHDPTIIQVHLNQVFPRFIEEAMTAYDTVIIDAPPVISCPETPAMTPFVDGVVFVVQAEKTKREVAQRSLEAIANFKGNVLGVVLNRKRYYIPEFLYKRI